MTELQTHLIELVNEKALFDCSKIKDGWIINIYIGLRASSEKKILGWQYHYDQNQIEII